MLLLSSLVSCHGVGTVDESLNMNPNKSTFDSKYIQLSFYPFLTQVSSVKCFLEGYRVCRVFYNRSNLYFFIRNFIILW